jgi:serine/threonine protein kinase
MAIFYALLAEFYYHLLKMFFAYVDSAYKYIRQMLYSAATSYTTKAEDCKNKSEGLLDLNVEDLFDKKSDIKKMQTSDCIGKIIGSGSYAKVFQYCMDEKLFAIKCIEFYNYIDLLRVLREVQILKYVRNCPHIVRFHKGFAKNDSVYLILDRYDNDLRTLLQINNNKSLTEPYVRYISYQIVSGLHYLHSEGILHRDIKPANILINYSSCKTVICDFNLSRVIGKSDVEAPQTQDVVTRWYKAPELLVESKYREDYGQGVDMWAFGCTVAELLIGQALWKGDDNESQYNMIVESIKNADFPNFISGDLLDFLKRIFQINPLLRMTAADALEHPWLKNSVHLYRNADASFITTAAEDVQIKSHAFVGHTTKFYEDKGKENFLYLRNLLEKELD